MPVMGRVLQAAPESQEDPYLSKWRNRREDALQHRRQFETIWDLCQLFLAGKQWVGLPERNSRTIVDEPNPQRRERYTVNTIHTHHSTMLGKLYVEDLRPELLMIREDLEAEEVSEHARAVSRYLWEAELDADKRLYTALHKTLTFGTSAIRCLFDNTQGKEIAEMPLGPDGRPITDPEQARAYVAEAAAAGQQAELAPFREGRVTWEALGPRSLLPPPGVEDPDYFPWLIVDRVMPVEMARLSFPDQADKIQEMDLRATETTSMTASDEIGRPMGTGSLKEHCIISTGYQMPTREYRRGHVCIWTQNEKLAEKDALPYELKGRPHHGVFFLRYRLVDGRFWATGVVEPMISPQRQKNRARSQNIEMKDRNLGRVYAKKGTITAKNLPEGKIMELIEVPLHADYPQETNGVPPGPWIQNEADICDADMAVAAGLRGEASVAEPPTGVSAYAALAMMAEQDDRRVGPILKDVRQQVADALMVGLWLARKFWQEGKHLSVAGQNDKLQVTIYSRAKLPEEFYYSPSKHAPLPTNPAAQAQKIFDVFHASAGAGSPLPPEWLLESLEQGRPMPIPRREEQVQERKAEVEHWLMQQGQMIQPDFFDDPYIHLQVHQNELVEASSAPGNEKYTELLLMHMQMHQQIASANKRPTTTGGEVPQLQGGHGVEAQTGQHANMQGMAQSTSGYTPSQSPTGEA